MPIPGQTAPKVRVQLIKRAFITRCEKSGQLHPSPACVSIWNPRKMGQILASVVQQHRTRSEVLTRHAANRPEVVDRLWIGDRLMRYPEEERVIAPGKK